MNRLFLYILGAGDFILFSHNCGHMSNGGFRSESLSTEAKTTIELLPLATHKPRLYLYAMLAVKRFFLSIVLNSYFAFLIFSQ